MDEIRSAMGLRERRFFQVRIQHEIAIVQLAGFCYPRMNSTSLKRSPASRVFSRCTRWMLCGLHYLVVQPLPKPQRKIKIAEELKKINVSHFSIVSSFL